MRIHTLAVLMGVLTFCHARAGVAACEAWTDYQGVKLTRISGSDAYVYKIDRIEIDADGAPNAYHPKDTGLDALKNAGYPDKDWKSVLVVDPDDRSVPYVQKTGQFAGYYLSMTTLEDRHKAVTDPARYVDATSIPYVVFPGNFFHRITGTGNNGVIGAARNLSTGRTSPVIFADLGGPSDPLGEVSIKLAENLGGTNVSPRVGAGNLTGPFAYVIFHDSEATPPWPLTAEQIDQKATVELAKAGGWDAVMACVGSSAAVPIR
jgi:hypothetical protein